MVIKVKNMKNHDKTTLTVESHVDPRLGSLMEDVGGGRLLEPEP